MNGLEYIYNTKNKLKTRFQGKGVNITDSTPFSNYPDFLESELSNKSWQYPSNWCQLTSRSEFTRNTVEFIVSDEFCSDSLELQLLVVTPSYTTDATVFVSPASSSGVYYVNDASVPLGMGHSFDYTLGEISIRIPKGLGVTDSKGNTTYKISVYAEGMTKAYLHRQDNDYSSEILAVRASSILGGIEIPLSNSNVKYVDLTLSPSPNTIFEGCKQLAKVELPKGTVLKSRQFKDCENLVEVIGADFTNHYEAEYVFYNCYRYKPVSLNYKGAYNYYNVNLSGIILSTPTGAYPIGFVSPFNYAPTLDSESCSNYTITINANDFYHNSLKDLKNAVIHLPEKNCAVTYTVADVNTLTNYKEDSFLYNYTSLVGGEGISINNPIGVYIDDFTNFKDTEIYLPKVPLLWLFADYNGTGIYGPIQRVVFNFTDSNFDTILGKISLQHQSLSKDSILSLFDSLPTSEVGSVIDLTGCKGVYELTDSELATLYNKNWVLIK